MVVSEFRLSMWPRTCLSGTYLRGKRGTACLSFPTISQVPSGRSFLSFINYWCSLSRDYIVLRLRSHTNYLLVAITKINLVDSNASSSLALIYESGKLFARIWENLRSGDSRVIAVARKFLYARFDAPKDVTLKPTVNFIYIWSYFDNLASLS